MRPELGLGQFMSWFGSGKLSAELKNDVGLAQES